jgi:hypothetical protein
MFQRSSAMMFEVEGSAGQNDNDNDNDDHLQNGVESRK